MNNKFAKKLRREFRRTVRKDAAAGSAMFVRSVMQSGFLARVVFACRIIFNVWPDLPEQKGGDR